MAIANVIVLSGPTVIKGVAGANIAITTLEFDFDAISASESVDNLLSAAFSGTVPAVLPGTDFGAPIGNALTCIGICDGGGGPLLDTAGGSGVLMQLDQVAQAIEFRRCVNGTMQSVAAATNIEATLMVSY